MRFQSNYQNNILKGVLQNDPKIHLEKQNRQKQLILEGLITADIETYFNDLVIKQYSIVTELDRKSMNKVENQEIG